MGTLTQQSIGILSGCALFIVLITIAFIIALLYRACRHIPLPLEPTYSRYWGTPRASFPSPASGTRFIILLQLHLVASTLAALISDEWASVGDTDYGLLRIYPDQVPSQFHSLKCDTIADVTITTLCPMRLLLTQVLITGIVLVVACVGVAVAGLRLLWLLTRVGWDSSLESLLTVTAKTHVMWAALCIQANLLAVIAIVYSLLLISFHGEMSPSTSYFLVLQAFAVAIPTVVLSRAVLERLPPPGTLAASGVVLTRMNTLRQQHALMSSGSKIAPTAAPRLGAPTYPISLPLSVMDVPLQLVKGDTTIEFPEKEEAEMEKTRKQKEDIIDKKDTNAQKSRHYSISFLVQQSTIVGSSTTSNSNSNSSHNDTKYQPSTLSQSKDCWASPPSGSSLVPYLAVPSIQNDNSSMCPTPEGNSTRETRTPSPLPPGSANRSHTRNNPPPRPHSGMGQAVRYCSNENCSAQIHGMASTCPNCNSIIL